MPNVDIPHLQFDCRPFSPTRETVFYPLMVLYFLRAMLLHFWKLSVKLSVNRNLGSD